QSSRLRSVRSAAATGDELDGQRADPTAHGPGTGRVIGSVGEQGESQWRGQRPRFSVIVAFLNAERFIAEAIESVLAQDYRDFELILVDDGSAAAWAAPAPSYAA